MNEPWMQSPFNPTGSAEEVKAHAEQWECLRVSPGTWDRRKRLIAALERIAKGTDDAS